MESRLEAGKPSRIRPSPVVWLSAAAVLTGLSVWGLCVLWRSTLDLPPTWPPEFNMSNATIPIGEIHSGGPPKDGIPALTRPPTQTAESADYLGPQDRVIGITIGGDRRAYPLSILNHHEVVNDRIGDQSIAVTYCPLCDSCAAFDRNTRGGELEFGVSGLLYNSNVLMFDRSEGRESLWSQLLARGVTGPAAGEKLQPLPLELTTWGDWRERHPDTRVLSETTGYQRDYKVDPYAGYFSSPQLMFPVAAFSDRLPLKSRVLGVWTGEASKAYPESAFSERHTRIEDSVGGKRVVVEFAPEFHSLRVVEAEAGVFWMYSLWFAWSAMHSETLIYVVPG